MPKRMIYWNLWVVLAVAPTFALSAEDQDQDVWTGVERIVAVGDIHGDYFQFVKILRSASVINKENRWIAGHTHLVQLGDVVDRGPYSKDVLDLLMALEEEAPRSGGRVHFLIGNHEVMRLLGNHQSTHKREYAAFRTKDAAKIRDAMFRKHATEERAKAKAAGKRLTVDRAFRKRWYSDHPLDRFQFLDAMRPSGKYGSWIRKHNAAVKINDILFVHGGISRKYATMPLRTINDTIRKELESPVDPDHMMAMDQVGPLWFRGMTRGSGSRMDNLVETTLKTHGVSRIVIGHTQTKGSIRTRFGGRIIMIDVGISHAYRGAAACLEVSNGTYYERRSGKRRRLSVGR